MRGRLIFRTIRNGVDWFETFEVDVDAGPPIREYDLVGVEWLREDAKRPVDPPTEDMFMRKRHRALQVDSGWLAVYPTQEIAEAASDEGGNRTGIRRRDVEERG